MFDETCCAPLYTYTHDSNLGPSTPRVRVRVLVQTCSSDAWSISFEALWLACIAAIAPQALSWATAGRAGDCLGPGR